MKTLITAFFFLSIFQNVIFSQDNWLNYTNNRVVTNVEEVSNGLWISSYGGLCFVNSSTGEEVYYNRGNSEISSNFLIDLIALPNDDLWISSSLGVCLFSNGSFYKGPQDIWGKLQLTPDNKLVVGTYDSLYIQDSGMEFKSLAYPEEIKSLEALEIDAEGNIYINAKYGFNDSYVAVYKNNEWEMLFSEGIFFTSIALDSKGTLWLTYDDVLKYWDNGLWNTETTSDKLNDYSGRTLFIDKDDNIVIRYSAIDSKILSWDGSVLSEIDFIQGTDNDCFFLKPSTKQNDLFYATSLSLGFYSFTTSEKHDAHIFTQSPIYSNSILKTLHPKDDSQIVVFSNKIQRIEGKEWTNIPLPTEWNEKIANTFLRNGNIHLCDFKSIWVYENEQWDTLDLPTVGFSGNISNMYIGENDELWILYNAAYLARYTDKWEVFGPNEHGFLNIANDVFATDKYGKLWFKTGDAIHSFDGESWKNYELPFAYFSEFVPTNDGVIVRSSKLLHFKDDVIDTIPLPPVGYFDQLEYEMTYDLEKERLYMGVTNHLTVYENNEWNVYSTLNSGVYNGFSNDLNLDNYGNLWLSGKSGGLGVFNPEGIVLHTEKEANFVNEPSIEVFPTCVSHSTINIMSKQSGNFDVRLLDINGKMIDQKRIFIPRESALEYSLPNCPSGMYFLSFHRKGKQITKKIVVITQ